MRKITQDEAQEMAWQWNNRWRIPDGPPSQKEFADSYGISTRTLRAYVKRYSKEPKIDDVFLIVERAIQALLELREFKISPLVTRASTPGFDSILTPAKVEAHAPNGIDDAHRGASSATSDLLAATPNGGASLAAEMMETAATPPPATPSGTSVINTPASPIDTPKLKASGPAATPTDTPSSLTSECSSEIPPGNATPRNGNKSVIQHKTVHSFLSLGLGK